MDYQNKKCCCNTLPLTDISVIESLAMVYSPYQRWDEDMIFTETGLDKGTIFADLDKPFYGYMASCGGSGTTCRACYTKPSDISRAKAGCKS